jgi:hypothetical protein
MFLRFADNRNPDSMASRFRRERIRRLGELLRSAAGGPRVLDVGGTGTFWRQHLDELGVSASVSILNLHFDEKPLVPGVSYIVGDARRMSMFEDQAFDICFSNSVIEHLGTFADQLKMAAQIRRVAKGYFVQTPNLYFPVEPHFLVPGWQFMPVALRAKLVQRRDFGWMKRIQNPIRAREVVESIRLLTSRDLQQLFPDSIIYREKLGPFTKSITAWKPIRGDVDHDLALCSADGKYYDSQTEK